MSRLEDVIARAENDARLRREQEARERDWRRNQEDHERRMREQEERRRQDFDRRMSGKGGGCFVASTLVETTTGARPIAAIEPGALVLTYDPDGQSFRTRRVLARKAYGHRPIWEVTTSRERTVATTGGHRFLTARGWVKARHLVVGDQVITKNGASAPVTAVAPAGRAEPVYNLITEGEHTFVAGGYVVHNYAWFAGLRAWLSRTFVERGTPTAAPLASAPCDAAA